MKDKQRILSAAIAGGAALFVLGTYVQAFLPAALGTFLIALRLIVLPVAIVVFMFTPREQIIYGTIVVLFAVCEVLLNDSFAAPEYVIALSVLSSPPFFKAGAILCASSRATGSWRAVLFTSLAFNVVTAAIYVDAILGGTIAVDAFTKIGRAGEDPLFRFSLGNAIELPALVAMVSVAAVIALRQHTPFVAVATGANLVGALISQSRFVVLLSSYTMIRVWWRSAFWVKLVLVVLVLLGTFAKREELMEMLVSLGRRFAGEDYNSAKARWEVFTIMPQQANLSCFTFGNGINSSLAMMQNAGLGYRTVEAAVLQVFYELGLIRVLLLAGFIVYSLALTGLRLRLRGEFFIAMIQILLALPVMSFTPLFSFCAGALCVSTRGLKTEDLSSASAPVRGGRSPAVTWAVRRVSPP